MVNANNEQTSIERNLQRQTNDWKKGVEDNITNNGIGTNANKILEFFFTWTKQSKKKPQQQQQQERNDEKSSTPNE